MAAAFSTHSNACVSEYSDHNYYMFSVFNRDQTSPAYLYDIASYWQKYAGNTSSVNLSFYRWNKEDILKVAKHKKDAGMLSYLGSLNAYLDACEKLNPNAWNYASKQERLLIQQSLTRLNNASKIYKGTQLKSQYALLRMRTNMMKGFTSRTSPIGMPSPPDFRNHHGGRRCATFMPEPCGKQGNITKHSKSMPSREIWQASECSPETIAILQASRAFISRIRTRQCSPIWCRIS